MKKFLFLLFFTISLLAFSQNKNQLDKLVNEIQKVTQNDKNLKLVWWIPTEYWQVSLKENDLATPDQISYLESILNDYTIVVAGDYFLDSKNGAVDFQVKKILNNVNFYGLNGEKILPLKNSEINPQLQSIVNKTLKPLFTQMLGKMGSGIEFFIYNNIKDEKRIIDPTMPGSFKIVVDQEVFQWKLPLISLMKEKTCPIDQEKMEGNWIFCPFHGEKL